MANEPGSSRAKPVDARFVARRWFSRPSAPRLPPCHRISTSFRALSGPGSRPRVACGWPGGGLWMARGWSVGGRVHPFCSTHSVHPYYAICYAHAGWLLIGLGMARRWLNSAATGAGYKPRGGGLFLESATTHLSFILVFQRGPRCFRASDFGLPSGFPSSVAALRRVDGLRASDLCRTGMVAPPGCASRPSPGGFCAGQAWNLGCLIVLQE